MLNDNNTIAPRVFKRAQVMQMMGVSADFIRNLERQGALKVIRFGRSLKAHAFYDAEQVGGADQERGQA